MLGLSTIIKKVFGTQNDRELKTIAPYVDQINQLEKQFEALTHPQLQAKTGDFRQRLDNGEKLDALLPEAFATVREAAKRTIGQRHYDVQLVGGVTLHRGRIAEMKTGEGKTLVSTLPCYLNALPQKGVHVVTVNDYLAKRDAEWMGSIHNFLGLSVGTIVHGIDDDERKKNYGADITYGTNNEYGFDYLRDNMKFALEDYVQRELNYAIVDEVDSILIDEARTPLIISGPSEESTDLYHQIDRQIRAEGGLDKETDYTVDEKSKTAALTEAGVEKMEKRLGLKNLYDPRHIETLHHVNQALRAHVLFKKDVDYVVKENQVMIVDEFTGRLMPGRRWSDGLHQAIEAKEGVEIENENQTLATITFQNYFRMYDKLSGMTGTADTEATEFGQIYKLNVSVIPTNRPMQRQDEADVIFKTEEAKIEAIGKEIAERQKKGQPVLVGTISVEKSEMLHQVLKKSNIKHRVLNAKQHESEAGIVAQAGRKGSVTIATNMAGRGTDIVLGGNPEQLAKVDADLEGTGRTEEEKEEKKEVFDQAFKKWSATCAEEKKDVLAAGGLFILGTERHESRRIDNQLRGRSGRQGDPGGSRFYLSLDDDLMRIFGGQRIKKFMEDDLPIEHRWINKAVENAQRKVEGHNYDIRKHLLQYDDVMNQQRKVVYSLRREVLGADSLTDIVMSMVKELAGAVAEDFFPNGRLPRVNGQAFLDTAELNDAIRVTFQITSEIEEKDIDPFDDKGLQQLIVRMAKDAYDSKMSEFGDENMAHVERMILLSTIDQLWKDHLLAMDHLREGIGLQGYGQKDPLVEYKKQGFRFFEMMMSQITGDVVRKVFAIQMAPSGEELELDLGRSRSSLDVQYNVDADGDLIGQSLPIPQAQPQPAGVAPGLPGVIPEGLEAQAGVAYGAGGGPVKPVISGQTKVGRNDPCPCGSGKKYKKCHGKG